MAPQELSRRQGKGCGVSGPLFHYGQPPYCTSLINSAKNYVRMTLSNERSELMNEMNMGLM